jgi:hypothetical protein
LYFYHFPGIFYGFPKLGRKEKEKTMNSFGLKLAQYNPRPGEMRRVRTRVGCFTQKPSAF